MRLLTIAVVLVLALAGAACGGGDEASEDTDTVVTETTDTTTDETTTDETTTDETTDDVGSLASGECLELVSAAAALGQAFAAGSTGDEDVSSVLDEYADRVPDEIRADIELLAAAYNDYAEALVDAGIEPGETPGPDDIAALQAAAASIDQQEISEASERVSAWAEANC